MPTTDDEMIEEQEIEVGWVEQYTEWQSPLAGMWSAIGKQIDGKRLAEYTRVFSDIPAGLLLKMVDQAIKDNGQYQTVPTIGACWDALKKILHNPRDLDAAVESWVSSRFMVYRFE